MSKGRHVRKYELEKFQSKLKKLTDGADRDRFFYSATMRLGNAVMGKAAELTPVGDYSDRFPPHDARVGGTLRDSWRITKPSKRGNEYLIHVQNPQKYASYVNYGHKQHVGQFIPPYRKNAKRAWIPGKYFLERAEHETLPNREKILKPLLDETLKKVFNDD